MLTSSDLLHEAEREGLDAPYDGVDRSPLGGLRLKLALYG